jgi:hypothetical protein
LLAPPFAGTFWAAGIQDRIEEQPAVRVTHREDICGDFAQEGRQQALVQGPEHSSERVGTKPEPLAQQVVVFLDLLCVAIPAAIVDYPDVAAGTAVADPLAAWFAVDLRGGSLEHPAHPRPRCGGSGRHQRRSMPRAFFAA